QTVPHQVHDTGLHGRVGPPRADRVRQSLRPSQHTINASATPRFFSSVSMVIHCFAPSPPVGPNHRPSTSRSPSMFTPITTYTGRFATWESRTLITIASINNIGYIRSNGRRCHEAMSSTIWSVIFEIVSLEISVP